MEDLILASASPRRADILAMLGVRFRVVPSGVSEQADESLQPADHVLQISLRKALAVAGDFPGSIVLGADTVVALGDEILEKPDDSKDAERMLGRLSGRTHTVYTGVVLASAGGDRVVSDVAATDVAIRHLEPDEIRRYVATGEPLDKAGAYAAQGKAAVFIDSISGCFFNVVGLPVSLLWALMGKMLGRSPWDLIHSVPAPSGLFAPAGGRGPSDPAA